MKSLPSLISIDGPAASGKSTIGRLLAERLGYAFLDTGVMYRAVTWMVLKSNIDVNDEDEVARIAKNININIRAAQVKDGRQFDVLVDGTDITWLIRQSQVNDNVSQVSTYPGVRSAFTRQQRIFGRQGKMIMVGRDIGTIVLPNADLKIYLEASVEERALRRFQELKLRGGTETYKSVLKSMKRRDEIDSKRHLAPLIPAEDAIIIKTDGKTIQSVLEEILHIIEKM